MAQKKSPEERELLIRLVGKYFLETGASTREIAAHFTELGFPLSNATVSDYIARYKKENSEKRSIIEEKIYDNAPKTIEDKGVEVRTMYATKYFLQGHTAEEIAKAFGVSPSVIYRDLNERLPQIETNIALITSEEGENPRKRQEGFYSFFKLDPSQSISELVEQKLQSNSMNNLKPKGRK